MKASKDLDASAVVPAGVKYELRDLGAFPARTLTEVNQTLSDLGLTPSATICVRLPPRS